MNRATVPKPHLVFCRVHVDIHACRVQLEKQNKGWVPAVKQDIAIGLTDCMGYQLVADHPAIHKEVLQVCLTARKGRLGDPAPKTQSARLALDGHGVLGEFGTADRRHSPMQRRLVGGRVELQGLFAVVTQREVHCRPR